jgi:hypothetical protein
MSESTRYRILKGTVFVELKLRQISQLFDSRDPSPFLERDLDDDAVDYIVSASLEHSPHIPIHVLIHLPEPAALTIDPDIVIEAVHNHFSYNAELIRKKLRRAMRRAQFSFFAGLVVLFACLTMAQAYTAKEYPYSAIIGEGLHILGWVAMWRPIDIFLYSWWPQVEMRKLFTRLSTVPVDFKFTEPAPSPEAQMHHRQLL